MEIYLGAGTYQGTPYMADEVAKYIVNELKLSKGDCISKDQIIEYLEKAGIGRLWATDVAMVLRNMFGVTATFFESVNGGLATELRKVVSESAETVTDDIGELTLADYTMAYGIAVDEAFSEAGDELDECVIAALSGESLESVADIAKLDEYVSEEAIELAEVVYAKGGQALIESWVSAMERPHMIRFMDSNVKEALSEALGVEVEQLAEAFDRGMMKRDRKQAAAVDKSRRSEAGNPVARGGDRLAALAKTPTNRLQQFQQGKAIAGAKAGAKQKPGEHNSYQSGEKSFAAKQINRAKADVATAKPMPFPTAPKPPTHGGRPEHMGPEPEKPFHLQTPARKEEPFHLQTPKPAAEPFHLQTPKPSQQGFHLKTGGHQVQQHPVKKALSWVGKTAHAIGKSFAKPSDGQQGGLGHRLVQGAKRVVKGVAGAVDRGTANARDVMRAKSRVRFPGLTHMIHGAPQEGELQAAAGMGMHREYARMGHTLTGASAHYRGGDHANGGEYEHGSREDSPAMRKRVKSRSRRQVPGYNN